MYLVRFTIIYFVFIITTSFKPHPLKMSYSVFTVSAKEKTISIENRFFADDFQKCLNKEYNQKYDFTRFHANKELRGVVDKFTTTYLKMKLNGELLLFSCTNSEYVADANLIYFRYTIKDVSFKKENKLEVSNKILLNYFTDQKNGMAFNLSKVIVDKNIIFDQKYFKETLSF